MRTIKFRGKRTDTKEWVYGFYNFTIYDDGSDPLMSIMRVHIIADADGYVWSIDENTVGQFTGLTDKNDKEIYEGDIVAIEYIDFDQAEDGVCHVKTVVEYETERMRFIFSKNGKSVIKTYKSCLEVIGNIFENGDLIK